MHVDAVPRSRAQVGRIICSTLIEKGVTWSVPNAWKDYTPEQLDELHYLCEGYKAFISDNKTERECCAAAVTMAEEAGYVNLAGRIEAGEPLRPGDKVYAVNRGKSLMLLHLGTAPLERGVNILGAPIDSPRLDVKQDPVEEKNEIVTLDTHYYGGVKKYQWVTIPLAIHGVVAKKDGSVVNVVIGEDEDDPVFCISDLLIHLSAQQMGKKASEVIEGEMLDVLVGNRPVVIEEGAEKDEDAEKSPVKAGVLAILHEQLDIEEEDLLSAELEVVPAGAARDLGLDRSMVLGYGQDDRVCAYTSLVAQLDAEAPARTAVTLLVDKEEIGSVGATRHDQPLLRGHDGRGAGARRPERAARAEALPRQLRHALKRRVRRALTPRSRASSSPRTRHIWAMAWRSTSTPARAARPTPTTRTPSTWPPSAASWTRAACTSRPPELGKVDAGGGGTIAYILATYGMNVIDCGVPVLSPCTRRGRPRARPTSTRPIAATGSS